MDPDTWTPKRGWTILLVHLLLRSLILLAVVWAVFFCLWGYLRDIYPSPKCLLIGVAIGLSAGWFVARKLEDKSGLADRIIVAPVLLIMLAAEVGGFWLAVPGSADSGVRWDIMNNGEVLFDMTIFSTLTAVMVLFGTWGRIWRTRHKSTRQPYP